MKKKNNKMNKNEQKLQRFSQASTIAGSFLLFVIYVSNYLWLFMIIYDYLLL